MMEGKGDTPFLHPILFFPLIFSGREKREGIKDGSHFFGSPRSVNLGPLHGDNGNEKETTGAKKTVPRETP